LAGAEPPAAVRLATPAGDAVALTVVFTTATGSAARARLRALAAAAWGGGRGAAWTVRVNASPCVSGTELGA
jgi:hypothetical protein